MPRQCSSSASCGWWFAAASQTRWSLFRSMAAAVDVAVWLWLCLYTDAVATAVDVAMIVAMAAVIVAMVVVAAVAKTEDIVFVA